MRRSSSEWPPTSPTVRRYAKSLQPVAILTATDSYEAIATAAKIADKGPLAVMATKEAVNRAYETTLSEGVRFERRMFHALFATEDQKEGMSLKASGKKKKSTHI